MSGTWEPRPVPELSEESAKFWQQAASGRLLLGKCTVCDNLFFYPRAACPYCLGTTTHEEASGEGTVFTYSISQQIDNWPEEDLPLIPAIVELKEGVRIFTNIVDADPDEVSIGTAVEVTFIPTERDNIAIPVFTPRGDA